MRRRALLAACLATLACATPILAQQPASAPDPRSAIPDPRSAIPDPRSAIPDPRSAIRDPRPFKVLTFNIHHAEGEDGKLDVARVAQVIRDSGADIVGLQEVDRGAERTGRRDLLKEIADLTGLRFAFGKNIDLQGGDYGNALLTRFPIVSEGNRLLPNVGGGEQRGVLQVVLDVHGTRVLVLTTHLDHRRPDPQRVASAEAIIEMLKAWGDGPAIAIGDFNDVPGSATYRLLTDGSRESGVGNREVAASEGRAGSPPFDVAQGGLSGSRRPSPAHQAPASSLVDVWAAVGKGDGYTIPVEAPRSRIDWILVRGLEPVSAEVLRTDASDHLPVIGVVRTP